MNLDLRICIRLWTETKKIEFKQKRFYSTVSWVRYHLREWSLMQAQEATRELFNLRHSKLRNVVERAFVVLKKKVSHINNTTLV